MVWVKPICQRHTLDMNSDDDRKKKKKSSMFEVTNDETTWWKATGTHIKHTTLCVMQGVRCVLLFRVFQSSWLWMWDMRKNMYFVVSFGELVEEFPSHTYWHGMWVSEEADVCSVDILYVTQASHQHCDFLSILAHNFLNLLSEIMLHVMTASTPNIACKWVRSGICIINLLSYICGRHKWCQRYVTHNIL